VSSRIESFVAQIDIRPDARVLEVGCGHGIAATLICRQLSSGRYTAIDRSAKMIRAAQARNHAFVAQGRAEFLVGALETVDLGDRRFNVALAMRVRLFHTDPARAEALVRRWLAPQGRLFVQYDAPVPRRR
jgi:ubiquinone/menaquinone biosynthesis C-methylase UbiE